MEKVFFSSLWFELLMIFLSMICVNALEIPIWEFFKGRCGECFFEELWNHQINWMIFEGAKKGFERTPNGNLLLIEWFSNQNVTLKRWIWLQIDDFKHQIRNFHKYTIQLLTISSSPLQKFPRKFWIKNESKKCLHF